jgi:large subunit ribosomal protein L10
MILTAFSGLDSERMNSLRAMVDDADSRYFVVKNRAFGIAVRERGLEGLCVLLRGQVGVIFARGEGFEVLKSVVGFGKENNELKVLGGFFQGQVRSSEEMLSIATMPPKEVAAGELVGTLTGPLSGLVQVLGEVARSVVFIIGCMSEKKEGSGSQ